MHILSPQVKLVQSGLQITMVVMVLQRAPKSAIVWGYIPVCERVVVQFDEKSLADAKLIPGTCKILYTAMYMPVDYI